MRLQSIKLSGFKSFVDPTTIRTPGQLVGIVGPNGCGKSNVMDAVRWVLGESKASELRGDSMQDVIFNGAGDRKPVGRASVELVFDNSLGRIGGAWGQYSELAIKRVLTREGDASYYINNQQVRRRDIHDLFLGTGLGPRAYAIIGQGMISRIIEAKPEELRTFLEEAAGVSRYKDRRKETEGRLSDARENLARVDDIRLELVNQNERLDAQAKVAMEYRRMDAERVQTKALLYGVKRDDARRTVANVAAELAATQTEIEAHTAQLRALDLAIESQRQAQYTHSDALQTAQTAFFTVNADFSRTEQQLGFERQRLQRTRDELARAALRLEEIDATRRNLTSDIESTTAQVAEREAAFATAQKSHADLEAAFPEVEAQLRTAQANVSALQAQLATVDQSVQVAQTSKAAVERTIARFNERAQRLRDESERLKGPDAQLKDDLEDALASERSEADEAASALKKLESDDTDFDARLATARGEAQKNVSQLSELRAKSAALANLQSKLESRIHEGQLGAWLNSHGLKDSHRLWQLIDIEAGWEDALEAVLRERLNAVPTQSLENLVRHAEPPTRLSVVTAGRAHASIASEVGLLLSKVKTKDVTILAPLADWLAGVRVAESLTTALANRLSLQAGESFVTAQGHVVTPHSVSYFKPESEVHGALARQREIDALAIEITALDPVVRAAQQQVAELERMKRDHGTRLTQERAGMTTRQRRIYDLELELVQLSQQIENASARQAQIKTELGEIEGHTATEKESLARIESEIQAALQQREAIVAERERARGARNEADVALTKARESVRETERVAREAQYQLRASSERVQELRQREAQLATSRNEGDATRVRLTAELGTILLAPLELALQGLLDTRKSKEDELARVRTLHESAVAELRGNEESKLTIERALEPLRQKLGERQLKEQAARLAAEQMETQLAELQYDQDWFVQALTEAPRAATLQQRLDVLTRDIDALGAVNLAALEELKEVKARKDYLDSQSADLTEAVQTLEDAIRRIDRETRALLQETYDQVNANFGRLFPTLFGGGQAKLVLTGDEILDAGIQVMAQPPGKRNTSIQLLSGGEKALTATALVFALFQLNPAPFCLLDEVDAPLDDANTERFCRLVREMASNTQFLFISHNKLAMEMAEQLIGITMPEAGVSRMVSVDIAQAMQMAA